MIVYEDTTQTIERSDTPTGTDAEGNPTYTYTRTIKAQPDNDLVVVHEDAVAQRILDKVQDLRDLATTVEGSPTVTTANIVAQFQAFKNELPDLLRAVAWLGERYVRD